MSRARDGFCRCGLGLLLLALCGFACAHSQPTWTDLETPAGFAGDAGTPQDHLQRGWARFLIRNELPQALGDFEKALKLLPQSASRERQLAWMGIGFSRQVRVELEPAQEAFLNAVETDPLSPESALAAWQLAECGNLLPAWSPPIITKLQALIERQPPPREETLRTLRLFLYDSAQRAGKWDVAESMKRKMGVVPYWRTAFPVGRHSLLAFDQNHLPETEPLRPSHAPNLLPVWPDDLQLKVEREDLPGLIYAEAYFYVSAESPLLFRLQGESPWTLFLDDTITKTHDAYRKRIANVAYVSQRVAPGWHRLLLKLPFRFGKIELGIEVIPAGGNPVLVQWWTGEGSAPGYPARASLPAVAQRDSSARELARRVEASPEDLLSSLFAGMLLWSDGDFNAAYDHLARIAQAFPSSGFAHYLLGQIISEDPELPDNLAADRSREQFRRAALANRQMLLARFRAAIEDGASGKEEEALAVLRELEEVRPSSFLWPYFAADLQDKLGWQLEASRSLHAAWQRLPDYPNLVQSAFHRALRNRSFSEAQLLATRLETMRIPDEDLISYWIDRKKPQLAGSLLRQWQQRFPSRSYPRLALVDLMMQQGDLSEAEKALAEAESILGVTRETLRRKIELSDRLGRFDQSRSLRNQWIAQAPWDLAMQQALAASNRSEFHLPGEPLLQTNGVIQGYLAANLQPVGSAVLVLDQTAVAVAKDGSSIEHIRTIAQVLTPEGLERWGEIKDLPAGAQVDRIRTIRADGRILDAETIPGKESVSLPGLQVGDFVEVSYWLGNHPQNQIRDGYIGERFYFQTVDMPIYHSLYSLAVPKDQELLIESHGSVPKQNHRVEGAVDTYTWEQWHQAAMPPEANAPAQDEYLPFVQAGFNINWQDVRDLFRGEWEEAIRPSFEIQQMAQKIVSSAADHRERIRLLYRAAANAVHGNEESSNFAAGAIRILAEQQGNRLVLLGSLLSAAGYAYEVFFARTTNNSSMTYRFPNNNTFTHGLIAVHLPTNAEVIWLDPTERNNAFSRLYPFVTRQPALRVTSPAGSDPWFTIPEDQGAATGKDITLDLALSESGELSGSGLERITSFQAVRYRDILGSMSANQQQQALETGLGNYFEGAVLKGYQVEALEDPDQPLQIRYQLHSPNFAHRSGDTLVLRQGFYPYQLWMNLIHKPNRSLPLLLGDETRINIRLQLRLPAGAKVAVNLPAHWTAPLSDFSIRFHQQGDQLILEKTLQVKAGRISPSDYAAFAEFCKKVDLKENEEIVIHLAPSKSDSVEPFRTRRAAATSSHH